MNRKTTTIIVTLAAALLFSTVGMASAVMIDGHSITFINPHTYDAGTDTSTWSYQVTSGSSPSLSHWTICWCNEDAIADGPHSEEYEYVEPNPSNPNNKINMSGIKFDTKYEDGDSRVVYFTLRGDYPESEWINVSTKAGANDEVYGWVTGPADSACSGCIVPELSTSILVSVGLLTLIGYFTLRRKKD